MKKFILTILLALVFALMLAYVFIYEKGPSKADKEGEKATIAIVDIPESEIKSIEIKGEEHLLLARSENKWRLAEPVDARIKEGALEGIIEVLQEFDAQSLVSDNTENLADFGLDNPATEVLVEKQDGQKKWILIGDKTPVGNGNYLTLKDSRSVYSISRDDASQFEKRVEDFRDDSIVEKFNEEDVVSITIESGENVKMCLRRTEENIAGEKQAETGSDVEATGPVEGESGKEEEPPGWYFAGRPEQSCVESAEGLLGGFNNGRAIDFVDEAVPDLVPLGLDYPRYKLTLGNADGSDKKFEIGKGIKSRYYFLNKEREEIYEIEEPFIDKIEAMKRESARIE
ncbi:MAG TPA: DUF4340 domain-containing protein [bacterium]|nr:DUF4340 domain-containing protein [bacterium]